MSTPTLTSMQVVRLAKYLEGTAEGEVDILERLFGADFEDVDLFDLPRENLQALDGMVMRCQSCDWWYSASEINEDGACRECAEEAP